MAQVTGLPVWADVDGFSPAKVDACFSSIAAVVGGSAWTDGSPQVYPGGIDGANFAASPRLPNSFKQQPYSPVHIGYCGPVIQGYAMPIGTVTSSFVATNFAIAYSGLDGTVRLSASTGADLDAQYITLSNGTLDLVKVPFYDWPPGQVLNFSMSNLFIPAGTQLVIASPTLLGNSQVLTFTAAIWGKAPHSAVS